MRFIVPLLLAVLFFSASAWADSREPDCAGDYGLFPQQRIKSENAWEKRNIAAWVAPIIAGADGDAQKEHAVALYYSRGYGVERDYKQAAEWELKSIQHGGPADAKYCLGYAYEHGLGVPKDTVRAANLYREAAEKHQQYAQLRLAMMYLEGRGVHNDINTAIKWCGNGLHMDEPEGGNPLYAPWKRCDSFRDRMPWDVQISLQQAAQDAKKQADKKNRYQNYICPESSKIVKMQSQSRKNRQPADVPELEYWLYAPLAYLDDFSRKYDDVPSVIIKADYDTLQPECVAFDDPYHQLHTHKRISLFLHLGGGIERGVESQKRQVTDTSRWRKEDIPEYPQYDHYHKFAVRSKWFDDVFIPKINELGVPYYINCKVDQARGGTICKLHTGYKGKLYLETTFSVDLLDHVPELYKKINQLLDRLSTLPTRSDIHPLSHVISWMIFVSTVLGIFWVYKEQDKPRKLAPPKKKALC